jgi:hypothetical protein
MHTVWNSRGRVNEVFAKFWEGGYIGVVKIFGGGYTVLVFYGIFINKFCKNFGGRVHFYPPSPPHPVCIYGSAHWHFFDQFQLLNRLISTAQIGKNGYLRSCAVGPKINDCLNRNWSQFFIFKHSCNSLLQIKNNSNFWPTENGNLNLQHNFII